MPSYVVDLHLLDEAEAKSFLLAKLRETGGNVRRACVLADLSRGFMYRLLARYGLMDELGRIRREHRDRYTIPEHLVRQVVY